MKAISKLESALCIFMSRDEEVANYSCFEKINYYIRGWPIILRSEYELGDLLINRTTETYRFSYVCTSLQKRIRHILAKSVHSQRFETSALMNYDPE